MLKIRLFAFLIEFLKKFYHKVFNTNFFSLNFKHNLTNFDYIYHKNS
jgi:hypothetical protein